MSKTAERITLHQGIDFEKIKSHQEIVQKKGLKTLGKEATGTALKTSITAIRFFSYLTVIFAIPVHLLTSLYYRSVAKKVIDKDNIAIIRNKCLFIPTEKEMNFLQKSNLVKRGNFLDESTEAFDAISEAHQVYDFARAFANERSSSSLERYLGQAQLKETDLTEIRKTSTKISNNNITYSRIPSWFKNISAINKTLNVTLTCEEDQDAIYELLNLLTNCGRELLNLGDNKTEQFDLIGNVYKEIVKQGFERDKAKTAMLMLLPLVIHMYNVERKDVGDAFATSFIEHSYLRSEIIDNPDDFIIQFNKHIKNRLNELNSREKIREALLAFQTEFNHPEHLEGELVSRFGEENTGLVRELLQRQDPLVIAGARSYNQSRLAEEPFTAQVRQLIPAICQELDLHPEVATSVLITEDLSTENFVEKKNLLKRFKPLFQSSGDSELIQKCFIYFSEGFIDNIGDRDYWSDWKKTLVYLNNTYPQPEFSKDAVAKALAAVITSLTQKNDGSHRIAMEQVGHACDSYAFFERDRRRSIRQLIETELSLFTLQSSLQSVNVTEVAQTVADQFKLELNLVKSYLHSPIHEDFIDQLRTLQLLSKKIPAFKGSIKNPPLVGAFLKAYGPDLFTKFLNDSQHSNKLKKVLTFGNDLCKQRVYSPKVVGKALQLTLLSLVKEKSLTEEEALEHLYLAAKSIIDNDSDEEVKCLLQEKLLQVEIMRQVKVHASETQSLITNETKQLVHQLVENFVVHKNLPKKSSVDYITETILNTLDLHFNEEASDTSITLSFASNSLLKKNLDELDLIRRPTFTRAAEEAVKRDAVRLDAMEDTITIDQEKLLFPLLVELLPGFCKNMIPEERKDLHETLESKLANINARFDESSNLRLELEEAYKHVGLVYTWLNLGPNLLEPFIRTAMNLVVRELQKAQDSLHQLVNDDITADDILEGLATNESTVAMKTFLPLAANLLTDIHEKHNRILEIQKRDVEPLIVTEGSDEEQRIDDYTNVVVLKPGEAVLMDILQKIPSSDSNPVRLIEKAAHLVQSSGGFGSWIARKVGSRFIRKQLNDSLGINEHHLTFIKDNIEDFISIGLLLVPHVMKRHNIRNYLERIHAIKSLVLSEEPLEQKELHLNLLEFLETIMMDLEEYQPVILDSLTHIHQNIA